MTCVTQGLNLATADTVIIYDSDFNPHMDLQALARSYRIGQKNDVMIYRLVTKGTIEERVMQLSAQKLELEKMIVRAGSSDGAEACEPGSTDGSVVSLRACEPAH
jgi:SNF2 family DNA or RNA helicase